MQNCQGAKPPLDRRLTSQDRDPVSLPAIDGVAVGTQGYAIEAHELEVVAELLVVVQHMLKHQAGIDDIGDIGRLSPFSFLPERIIAECV